MKESSEYQRAINRIMRLKKLQDLHGPDLIIENEKRLIKEAVDNICGTCTVSL